MSKSTELSTLQMPQVFICSLLITVPFSPGTWHRLLKGLSQKLIRGNLHLFYTTSVMQVPSSWHREVWGWGVHLLSPLIPEKGLGVRQPCLAIVSINKSINHGWPSLYWETCGYVRNWLENPIAVYLTCLSLSDILFYVVVPKVPWKFPANSECMVASVTHCSWQIF